jgi:hypothetical protein
MRANDAEFPFGKTHGQLNGSTAHTLYIRLEKKCHPKYCSAAYHSSTNAGHIKSTHVTFLGTKAVTFRAEGDG